MMDVSQKLEWRIYKRTNSSHRSHENKNRKGRGMWCDGCEPEVSTRVEGKQEHPVVWIQARQLYLGGKQNQLILRCRRCENMYKLKGETSWMWVRDWDFIGGGTKKVRSKDVSSSIVMAEKFELKQSDFPTGVKTWVGWSGANHNASQVRFAETVMEDDRRVENYDIRATNQTNRHSYMSNMDAGETKAANSYEQKLWY